MILSLQLEPCFVCKCLIILINEMTYSNHERHYNVATNYVSHTLCVRVISVTTGMMIRYNKLDSIYGKW